MAPLRRAANSDAEVERRVKEKDVTLARRVDQLAGAVSVSKIEISGHKRAAERAERRKQKMSGKITIRVQSFSGLFRRLNDERGRFADHDFKRLAKDFGGGDESLPVIRSAARFYRSVDPVSVVTETGKKGAYPIVRKIKVWDGADGVSGDEGNTIKRDDA